MGGCDGGDIEIKRRTRAPARAWPYRMRRLMKSAAIAGGPTLLSQRAPVAERKFIEKIVARCRQKQCRRSIATRRLHPGAGRGLTNNFRHLSSLMARARRLPISASQSRPSSCGRGPRPARHAGQYHRKCKNLNGRWLARKWRRNLARQTRSMRAIIGGATSGIVEIVTMARGVVS